AWITLLLAAGLGLWMLLVQRNVHLKESDLARLKTDLTQSETEVDRLNDLLKLQDQLNAQNEIFEKIGRPVDTTKLLATLDQLMPQAMALIELSIETEEATKSAGTSLASRAAQEKSERKLKLKLHGVAPTDVDVGDFLVRLAAKPLFSQVELAYSHERVEAAHVMRDFAIT